jgi:hypothetical protein
MSKLDLIPAFTESQKPDILPKMSNLTFPKSKILMIQIHLIQPD